MAVTPIAGSTHDITLASGATKYGFMIAPGSYRTERVDDFAPRIATGTDSKTREGYWDSYSQSSASEGVDQEEFLNINQIASSDGNVFTDIPLALQLDSAWTTADASGSSTAPMIIDFGPSHVVAGCGTSLRRSTDGVTWSGHTTPGGALAASIVWMHEHNTFLFVAVNGNNYYRSDTNNPAILTAGAQTASCFTTWTKSDQVVYLVLATSNTIKTSSDNGTTWSAAINVGNSSSIITGMSSSFGYLLIGKEDGLWRYDGTALVDIVQYPVQKNSTNFRCIVPFDGFIYTHMMGRIIKIALTSGTVSSLVDITPEMKGSAVKELYGHGKPIWMFTGPFVLYAAFNSGRAASGGYPEMMAYSGSGWHQRFAGRTAQLASAITAVQTTITIDTANIAIATNTVVVGSEQMTVSSVDATGLILTVVRGANSTTAAIALVSSRLTVLATVTASGYSSNLVRTHINLQANGTIYKSMISLRDIPFPLYPTDGVFETSDYTGDLPFMQKAFRGCNVEARNLSTTDGRSISVSYSTDKGVTFVSMGTVITNGRTNLPFSLSSQTTLSDSATINSNSIRLKFTLTRGTTSSETPVLTRYTVDFLNRPLATHAHSMNLRLGTTMTIRNGTLETVSVLERLQFIKDIEDAESPLRFIDMTGRHYLVYLTKTSVVKVEKENEDERMVAIVMVDAVTGLWPQIYQNVTITTSATAELLDFFYFDFDVFDTPTKFNPGPDAYTSTYDTTDTYDLALARTSERFS